MNPSYTLPKSSQYISMRVHGTSAHIHYDPADMPAKQVRITYSSGGTIVESNYPAHIGIYFSIPTPVQVEKRSLLFTLISRIFTRDQVDRVFEGLHLRVVRVEIYLGNQRGVNLGELEIMDGSKKLASAAVSTIPLIDANTDPYQEKSPGTIRYDIDREVDIALGIKLTAGFSNLNFDENQLHLIAAKAIFAQSKKA